MSKAVLLLTTVILTYDKEFIMRMYRHDFEVTMHEEIMDRERKKYDLL